MDGRDRSLAKAMFNEVPRKVEWAEASATTHMRWLLRAQEIRKRMEAEEPKSRLVPDWKTVLLRSWSIRLAVLAPVALSVVWDILASLPPELRVYVKLPVFVAFAAMAGLARIWNQKPKG